MNTLWRCEVLMEVSNREDLVEKAEKHAKTLPFKIRQETRYSLNQEFRFTNHFLGK